MTLREQGRLDRFELFGERNALSHLSCLLLYSIVLNPMGSDPLTYLPMYPICNLPSGYRERFTAFGVNAASKQGVPPCKWCLFAGQGPILGQGLP